MVNCDAGGGGYCVHASTSQPELAINFCVVAVAFLMLTSKQQVDVGRGRFVVSIP